MGITTWLSWGVRVVMVVPTLVKDIDATINKIKADTDLEKRVTDGVEGAVSVLEEIAGKL